MNTARYGRAMPSHLEYQHRFRAAVERRDHAAIVATLADNIVLHSPVLYQPFEGRDTVARLFEILLDVFEDFTYIHEWHDDQMSCLRFTTKVGEKQVEGVDILRYDNLGQIEDFTVMVRPLSAVQALADAVGSRLLEGS